MKFFTRTGLLLGLLSFARVALATGPLPPVVIDVVPDTTVIEDFGSSLLYRDLTTVFFDPDNTILNYSILSVSSKISATVSGNFLYLSSISDSNGFEDIIVSAEDCEGQTVNDTFTVTITPVPDGPKFLYHIPDQVINEDAAKTFLAAFPSVFYDPDENLLTYTVVNLKPSIVSIERSNDNVYAIPVHDSNGVAMIVVSAWDGTFTSKDTFLLTILPVNDAPSLVSTIRDTMFFEEFSERFVYKLSSYFRDVESNPLTFSAVDASLGVIPRVSQDSLYLKSVPNYFGQARLSISAFDGLSTGTSTFVVQVMNINDTPFVNIPIADQTISEDAPRLFLSKINSVFTDPDGDALIYTTASSKPSILAATLSNDSIYILPAHDSSGIVSVMLIAGDSAGEKARDTFSVTINPVNDPPRLIKTIPDTSFAQNFGRQFIAKLLFADVDSPILQYTAIPFSSGILTFISADSLYIQSTQDFFGSVLIRVRASDGVSFSADTFRVTLRDTKAPEVFVNALASPWANIIRFVVGANETVTNLKINVNGRDLEVQKNGALYFSDYAIVAAEDINVRASGADIADNRDTVNRAYSVASTNKGIGPIRMTTLTNAFILTRPANVQKSSALIFLTEPIEVISTTAEPLRLESSWQSLMAHLSHDADPEKVGFYEYADGTWRYLGGRMSHGQLTGQLEKNVTLAIAYDPEWIVTPKRFALEQNYPNPFNPSTTIRYHVPYDANVSIRIFNLLGQEIRVLVNEKKPAGIYSAVWDGRSNNAQFAASGVYLYRIEAGNFVQTRKMVLVK